MKNSKRPQGNNHHRTHSAQLATAFFGEDYDPDQTSDRYARARDRAVTEKHRHRRTRKPVQR